MLREREPEAGYSRSEFAETDLLLCSGPGHRHEAFRGLSPHARTHVEAWAPWARRSAVTITYESSKHPPDSKASTHHNK